MIHVPVGIKEGSERNLRRITRTVTLTLTDNQWKEIDNSGGNEAAFFSKLMDDKEKQLVSKL